MNNNVSFQGRTTLILDPKVYDRARSLTSSTYRHLSSQNNCKLINGKVYTSEADARNIAVLVRSEKDGIIKHVPINGKVEVFIDEIARKIENLKKLSKGKLTAWIIGGDGINMPNGCKTVETVNKIADVICDRPDIDTSILAGSKTGSDRIVLHTLNDMLEITLDKPLNKANAEAGLQEYYDIVELNNTNII